MAARLGAALAMLLVVPGAFLGAGIANLRTDTADFLDEPRASAHERDAETAHFRAIETEPGAIRHAAQAFIGAVIAFLGAATTRANTRLMLLMRHDKPPDLRDREEGDFLYLCNPDAMRVAADSQNEPPSRQGRQGKKEIKKNKNIRKICKEVGRRFFRLFSFFSWRLWRLGGLTR